jgi:Domain of unknown function (DUF4404)
MPAQSIHELLDELESTLRMPGNLSQAERARLTQVHADLKAAVSEYPSVAPPHPLGERVREAVDRLQAEHPRLSGLLTAALDALSDLGV